MLTAFRILIVLTAVLLVQQPAHALNEIEARRQGVYFFDENPQVASCASGSSGGILIGENNVEMAYNNLLGHGLTGAQAAGVIGNLIGETEQSPLDPTLVEGGGNISDASQIRAGQGFGIAQWTTAGRQQALKDFASSSGRSPLDLGTQLDFLWFELQSNSGYGLEPLQAAGDDLRQATWIFLSFFERPAAVSGSTAQTSQPTSGSALNELERRLGFASPVAQQYAGLTAPAGLCVGGVGEPSYAADPSIQVDGSPPGAHTPSNCTGDFTVGAQALREFVLNRWSLVSSVGGYSCRAMVGGIGTSVHGLGRAIDIMIDANNPAEKAQGDEIRNFLINNAQALGIQRVIWDCGTWSPDKEGWRPYCGGTRDDHDDHLHVEINIEASTNPNLI